MNSNELNEFKQQYQTVSRKKDIMNSLRIKKEELEKNDVVKLYCQILNEMAELNDDINYEQNILDNAIANSNIKNTNGIYVYFGSFYKNIFNQEIPVDHMDHTAQYSVYMDIEKVYSSACITIPIESCESFERDNVILFPKDVYSERWILYERIRRMFFETCVVEGQEKAIEKVLKIRDNK